MVWFTSTFWLRDEVFALYRMRHDADPAVTFPAVRAIVIEVFTAPLFAQKPSYLKRIQELQNIQLRI